MDTIIIKLKKIKELAERGEQGEALVARSKLYTLLSKYNIKLEDLEKEVRKFYKFTYMWSWEKTLILYCLSTIIDDPNLKYSYFKGKKEVNVELTEWQYAEAIPMIKFHKKQLKKEIQKSEKNLLNAYINKHNIFAESDKEGEELSEEKLIEYIKALKALEDTIPYKKQLNK